MVHPLVTQLRFTRSELIRCTKGITNQEAIHRFGPMNCISWIVGHLAAQEHFLWIELAQGINIAADLYPLVGFGKPASTPALEEIWSRWQTITDQADQYLDTITPETLHTYIEPKDMRPYEDVGTLLLRNIYHYWFHIGEAHAIRQMLGHTALPQFVGDMSQVIHSLK